MTVAAILRQKGHEIASVSPTTKISQLITTLNEWRIGAVLVRDAAGQLLGIVSERDIVRSLARDGAACLDMTAAQLMTRVLHTVTPATATDVAMGMMTASRVRHLPVIEGDALVGMISIGDVVKAQLDAQSQEVEQPQGLCFRVGVAALLRAGCLAGRADADKGVVLALRVSIGACHRTLVVGANHECLHGSWESRSC